MVKNKKRKWWQLDASSSAAQPADSAPEGSSEQPWRKPRWRCNRSAAQPADDAPEGSAEQHVHPSVDDTSKLHASIGYLAFEAKDYTSPAARQQILKSFREAMKWDLAVIHMVFPTEADLLNVWDDINEEIVKTMGTSSVAQPAYQLESNLLSVWSQKLGQPVSDDTNRDPTREVPAICLTFDTAVGRISSINSSWPTLSRTTRKRFLEQYSKQAQETGSVIHTIGGQLGASISLENLLHPVDASYAVSAHESVCVLANSSDEWINFYGVKAKFATAHAVVVQVWHENTSAADSDAHPVEAKPPSRKRKADQAPNSDEHPVRASPRPRKEKVTSGIVGSDTHPAVSDLRAPTPLWDNVLAKLDRASSSGQGQQMMKFITETCFHGKLCHKNAYGEDLEKPMALTLKMEILLETAAKRRKIVLNSLSNSAAQPVPDTEYVIAEEDMREMWNTWRWDVESWMSEKNLKTYYDLLWWGKRGDAQKMTKSLFSAFKQHVSGCKFLLHKLIQLPIIAQCQATSSDSAEQPASITALLEEFRVHKESDGYKSAVKESAKKAKEHKRLSKEICNASWKVGRGKELSQRAKNGEWKKLTIWERELVEQYDGRKLERNLKALLHQAEVRPERYRGFGVNKQPTVCASSAVQPAASSSSAGQPAASSSSAMKSEPTGSASSAVQPAASSSSSGQAAASSSSAMD